MIGKNVFYVDFTQDKINTAYCTGMSLEKNGYLVCELTTDQGVCSREKAFVFLSETEALQAFNLMKPIYTKMKDVQQKCKQELDELRQMLIGKPIGEF